MLQSASYELDKVALIYSSSGKHIK